MFLWKLVAAQALSQGLEVTYLFLPLTLILNPVYHRELSPSGLSKQSVNRIFTPFVQYSEKFK